MELCQLQYDAVHEIPKGTDRTIAVVMNMRAGRVGLGGLRYLWDVRGKKAQCALSFNHALGHRTVTSQPPLR